MAKAHHDDHHHDDHHDDHHHDDHGDHAVHQAPWVTVLTIAITFGSTAILLLLKSLGKG